MTAPVPVRPGVLAAALLVVLSAGCFDGDGPGFRSDACPEGPIAVTQDLTVRNSAGGGRLGPTASQEFPLAADGAGIPWSCVRAITATIRWTNAPNAGADLYVGLEAPDAGVSAVGHDRQQAIADGEHEEQVVAPVAASQAAALASGVVLVVYTDWASLSQSGLHVQATVEFTLAGA